MSEREQRHECEELEERCARLSSAVATLRKERDEGRVIIELLGVGNAATVAAGHSPCLLCGYNGANWWQKGSHKAACAVREIGGEKGRIEFWRARIASREGEEPGR